MHKDQTQNRSLRRLWGLAATLAAVAVGAWLISLTLRGSSEVQLVADDIRSNPANWSWNDDHTAIWRGNLSVENVGNVAFVNLCTGGDCLDLNGADQQVLYDAVKDSMRPRLRAAEKAEQVAVRASIASEVQR